MRTVGSGRGAGWLGIRSSSRGRTGANNITSLPFSLQQLISLLIRKQFVEARIVVSHWLLVGGSH
jgi:hypothetical protein